MRNPTCRENRRFDMTKAMRTADQTLDEILNLAAAHFKVGREKLTPDEDFFKSLGIDSLAGARFAHKAGASFSCRACRITKCKVCLISAHWPGGFSRGCK